MKSRKETPLEGGGERWKMKKKNVQRLGGGKGGLSLHAFANAKSINNSYNPALLKKKREFYKNAKFVNKYKKMVRQKNQPTNPSSSVQLDEENYSNSGNAGYMHRKNKKNTKGSYSLEGLYEKKREEQEEATMEREAIIKAKKEGKEKAEVRRKDLKVKMYKKTRKGQPVMKYRIEHILETLQSSSK